MIYKRQWLYLQGMSSNIKRPSAFLSAGSSNLGDIFSIRVNLFPVRHRKSSLQYTRYEYIMQPKLRIGLLLMEYAKAHPKEPLPIIYPVVIYTGEEPYTESMDFFDLFGKYNALAKQHMLSAVKLVDVCRMADEDIRKHRLFGLSEYVFKYKKDKKRFDEVLKEILPWAHEVELELHKDYVIMIIRYMVDVYPNADYEALVTGIKRYLSEDLENEAMTIAQQLRQQGVQQGMQQGMQQGESKMLLRQLTRKFNVVPESYRQQLLSANDEQLLNWGDRVLDAESLDEVFE